jgi:hypothetical protein
VCGAIARKIKTPAAPDISGLLEAYEVNRAEAVEGQQADTLATDRAKAMADEQKLPGSDFNQRAAQLLLRGPPYRRRRSTPN